MGMFFYILLTTAITAGLCVALFRFFDKKIHEHELKLDDGRGYFLIAIIIVAFSCAAITYYSGAALGFAEQDQTRGLLVVAIMINMIIALLCLTFGLVRFRPGERY